MNANPDKATLLAQEEKLEFAPDYLCNKPACRGRETYNAALAEQRETITDLQSQLTAAGERERMLREALEKFTCVPEPHPSWPGRSNYRCLYCREVAYEPARIDHKPSCLLAKRSGDDGQ